MQNDNQSNTPPPNMRPRRLAAWLGLGLSKTYELMKADEVPACSAAAKTRKGGRHETLDRCFRRPAGVIEQP